ncbi:MAG: class I SAM-dependent methyltransferase [Acidimicrobiales bacterium]
MERIVRRSGELTFEPMDLAGVERPDVRHRWLSDWIGARLEGARVADVGCWTGSLLAWARQAGAARTVGIDLEGPWLEIARSRPEVDDAVPITSLEAVPRSLCSAFDIVFFLETLEHLPSGTEASALGSVASLVAPAGWLILSTPIAGVASLLDPAWVLVGHRHYRPATVRRLLRGAGLAVDDTRYSGNVWGSVDTFWFYLHKHLLHTSTRAAHSSWLEARSATGLQSDRMLGSTNVWMRATPLQVGSAWPPSAA